MYDLASVLTLSCVAIPQAPRRMISSSALPTLQPQVCRTHCSTPGSACTACLLGCWGGDQGMPLAEVYVHV